MTDQNFLQAADSNFAVQILSIPAKTTSLATLPISWLTPTTASQNLAESASDSNYAMYPECSRLWCPNPTSTWKMHPLQYWKCAGSDSPVREVLKALTGWPDLTKLNVRFGCNSMVADDNPPPLASDSVLGVFFRVDSIFSLQICVCYIIPFSICGKVY